VFFFMTIRVCNKAPEDGYVVRGLSGSTQSYPKQNMFIVP
jgi:hypothetical protein